VAKIQLTSQKCDCILLSDPPDEISNLKTFSLRYQIYRVIPTKVAEMGHRSFDFDRKHVFPFLCKGKVLRFYLLERIILYLTLITKCLFTQRVHELTGYF